MKISFSFLILFSSFNSIAQDISYNRKIVDTLTSPYFWGRGYTKDGMKKAADFLSGEFKNAGLQPLNKKDFLQKFSFSANTFPRKMEVEVNGKKLEPGTDYIVGADSHTGKAEGRLQQRDSTTFVDAENKIVLKLENKLTWDASQTQEDYNLVRLDKKRFTELPKNIKINIEAKLIKKFDAANVCAMVAGTEKPDSFIFITAHYDHLGGMGSETYFPGANDNASGVALLLSLAKYYAAHPQKYSIGFILFAAEEIGLLGSKYYTEHPIVPLKNIRFLTNTDLAGTGEEGITVVNATIFEKEFALMNKINDENKYLVSIGARGKAANSDHYWFTEKGVPAFFFYTKGGIAAYHDVFDKAATLPLNEQEDLMQLMIKFNEGLQILNR
ncbi:MAG: M28 family metallopeptidase [Ferruginibacter sp.]